MKFDRDADRPRSTAPLEGAAFQPGCHPRSDAALRAPDVGLSVRTPSVHVFGRGGVNRDTTYDGAGTETMQLAANGSFRAQSPLRIGLGTGVEGRWGQLSR